LEVVKIAVGFGIDKIRLTGGEPLVRKGITDLITMISKIGGINDLALTTNGILLDQFARQLASAGLKRVNISLDTVNPEKYKYITRGGNIEHVLSGIESAKIAGLHPVKINAVLADSFSKNDRKDLEAFCLRNNLELRFIHPMNLGTGKFHSVEGGVGGRCNLCNRIRLTTNYLIKPCLFNGKGYDIRELGIVSALKMAVENKPLDGSINTVDEFYNIGG
jgi:cyclic pyranopterin phosphate synthase